MGPPTIRYCQWPGPSTTPCVGIPLTPALLVLSPAHQRSRNRPFLLHPVESYRRAILPLQLKAFGAIKPVTIDTLERSFGISLNFRWWRGHPRPVCVYHPWRLAKFQSSTICRSYCSIDCYQRQKKQLFCRTPWEDDQNNKLAEDLQLTATIDSGWVIVGESLSYVPTEADIACPLILECRIDDGRPWLDAGPSEQSVAALEIALLQQGTNCGQEYLLDNQYGTSAGTGAFMQADFHYNSYYNSSNYYYNSYAASSSAEAYTIPPKKTLECVLRHTGCVTSLPTTSLVVPYYPTPSPPPYISLTSPSPLPEDLMHRVTQRLFPQLRAQLRLNNQILPPERIREVNPGGYHSFTIMTWNILSDTLVNPSLYWYCPTFARDPKYRHRRIKEMLVSYNADVICLQEVTVEVFVNVLRPVLEEADYKGFFKRKRGVHRKNCSTDPWGGFDGCATFWRKSRFRLVEATAVDLHPLMLHFTCKAGKLSGLEAKDNVALLTVLEDLEGPPLRFSEMKGKPVPPCTSAFARVPERRMLLVTNTHILANPMSNDLKACQVTLLFWEICRYLSQLTYRLHMANGFDPSSPDDIEVQTSHQVDEADVDSSLFFVDPDKLADGTGPDGFSLPGSTTGGVARHPAGPVKLNKIYTNIPYFLRPALIVTGDFNTLPDSPLYQLITTRSAKWEHFGLVERSELWEGFELSHRLPLRSGAATLNWRLNIAGLGKLSEDGRFEPLVTNFTAGFKGCLDYIFCDNDALTVTGGRVSYGPEALKREAEAHQLDTYYLPSELRPSDHLPVMVGFAWKEEK